MECEGYLNTSILCAHFSSDVLSKVILLSECVNYGSIPLPGSLGLPLNFDKKIRFAIELHICVTNMGGRGGVCSGCGPHGL